MHFFFYFSMQERSTPITTQFNQTLPSQRSCISSSGSLHSETVISLDKLSSVDAVNIELNDLLAIASLYTLGIYCLSFCYMQGKKCVVRVELGKLDSIYGWNYDGCAKCSL